MLLTLKNTLTVSTVVAFTLIGASQSIAMDDKHNNHSTILHTIQLKLNHAVAMAAKGSNLVVKGQLGISGKVDVASVKDGKKMIAESRHLINKVMKSNEMRDLHLSGITGTNDLMMRTHNIGEAALNYINFVDNTNAVSKSAMHDGMSHKNMNHKDMTHKVMGHKAMGHKNMPHKDMANMKTPMAHH